jgi:hypothetical protein
MRLATFVIALLLLAGSVDPTRGWLIAFVVVSGLAAMRWHSWRPFTLRPALDLRLGAFALAVMLLAGVIDPTRDWLIATTVVAGLAMFDPGLLSLDAHHHDWRWDRRWRFRGGRGFRRDWRAWDARWGNDWDGEDWR